MWKGENGRLRNTACPPGYCVKWGPRMDDRARALSALHAVDPGCPRDEWIRIGMAAKAPGLSLEVWTEWSRPAANFKSERDCADAWRSFRDGAIKAGTLYALAFSAGWKDSAR